MRLPWIDAAVYKELSPKSVKILSLVVAMAPRGRLRTLLCDLACRAGMSDSAARSALRELGEHGIIRYESSTQGYSIEVPYSKRFTHVPGARLNLLMAMSPTAVKVYVMLCRSLQPTHSVRALIATIADRVDRSRRTVQLALREIRRAGLSWSIRTGRSSIHVIDPEQQHLFRSHIAHRSRLLLRVLRSTPRSALSRTLGALKMADTDLVLRDLDDSKDSAGVGVEAALHNAGVGLDARRVMMGLYTRDEIAHALDMLAGRRTQDAAGFLERVLRRGWCAWVTG